jgi:hypothetical protein
MYKELKIITESVEHAPLIVFWQRGFFYMPHLLRHRTSILRLYPKDRGSHLYDEAELYHETTATGQFTK